MIHVCLSLLSRCAVSGTFVKTIAGGVLFDCGEGSLGQLYRRYGTRFEEVCTDGLCLFYLQYCGKILLGLRLVLISHIHADHHLGLIRLLTARTAVRETPLSLFFFPPPSSELW